MAYSYVAGAAVLTHAMVATLRPGAGDERRIGNGSFLVQRITGINEQPDQRQDVVPLAHADGETTSGAYYNGRSVLIECAARADNAADARSAAADIKAQVALWRGFQTWGYRDPEWSEYRQHSARLAGPVTIEVPPDGGKAAPWRLVTIPLRASDPRLYAATQRVITLDYASTQFAHVNDGDTLAPFVVRFTGPVTNPKLIRDASDDAIELVVTLTSGQWIEVDTAAHTVKRETGANVFSLVDRWDLHTIPPGGASLRGTGTGTGAGTAITVTYRDAWL